MHLSERIAILAQTLGLHFKEQGWQLLLAESCTGGQLAAAVTQCPGSSDWFSHSLVTYSNAAKMQFLKLDPEILDHEGAVSARCAEAMVRGLNPKRDQVALATTGYAGPSGNRGQVFLAWLTPRHELHCEQLELYGQRMEIIQQTVFLALRSLVLASFYPAAYVHLRYFFALVCDDKMQTLCFNYGCGSGIEIGFLEPKANLHLTLAYLGKLSQDEKQMWMQKAATLAQKHQRFTLRLGGLKYWTKPDAYILECQSEPELNTLATALGADVNFHPHLSLSKRNPRKLEILPDQGLNQNWQIEEFALCASLHGAIYFECARWTLSMRTKEN